MSYIKCTARIVRPNSVICCVREWGHDGNHESANLEWRPNSNAAFPKKTTPPASTKRTKP